MRRVYDKGYDLSSRASPRSNTTYVPSLIWDCVYHDVEFSKTPSHSRRPIQTYLSTSLFVVSAKQRSTFVFVAEICDSNFNIDLNDSDRDFFSCICVVLMFESVSVCSIRAFFPCDMNQ